MAWSPCALAPAWVRPEFSNRCKQYVPFKKKHRFCGVFFR
jgi:hypothetical protein